MSRRWLVFSLFVLLAVVGGCGSSDEADPQAGTPPVDGPPVEVEPAEEAPADLTALELLDSVVAAYRNAESYFDNAEYHESFMRQGENVPIEPPAHQVSVVLQRPNQVRVNRRVPEGTGPALDVAVASDGRRLVATISDLPDQVLDLPAPATLTAETIVPDPQLRKALLPVPLANLYPQLDLMLAGDEAPPRLFSGARVRLLADKTIDDATCHRVELDRTDGRFLLWIDAETRLIRRMEASTAALRRQLDPQGVMLDWRLWIDFLDASAGGPMADEIFQLDPPQDAKRVEAFQPAE